MQTEILQPTQENLLRAAELIKRGELVAFPTETVYGLGADGLNVEACRKIFTAKGRPSDKPLSLHVSSLEMVERVAKISAAAEKLFAAFCPGALTIILPKNKIVPDFVTGGRSSVGIRFPANDVALELIKLAEVPIAAPSANLSGKTPPKTAQEVFDNLSGRVEIILDGGACTFGVSSTIIDLTAEPKILRHGAISAEKILEVLK
ncbi:MAG: threonylcarbamoyl-AMP synthase [Quinella sp. 3Q1]|nr:threonylcarbamoyl-AMP synthase [Quinella sp. 3Q1]MBR6889348.1 threonylcarbamoyl-AMP synthase [Selenomonadaceae bacterium]